MSGRHGTRLTLAVRTIFADSQDAATHILPFNLHLIALTPSAQQSFDGSYKTSHAHADLLVNPVNALKKLLGQKEPPDSKPGDLCDKLHSVLINYCKHLYRLTQVWKEACSTEYSCFRHNYLQFIHDAFVDILQDLEMEQLALKEYLLYLLMAYPVF